MKTLTTIMAAHALLLATVLGYAQAAKALPSEIDLRAAYCITIVQYLISLVKPLPDLPSPAKDTREEARSKFTSDLRRLQLYLLPRLPHLEMLGVITAQTRAEEDIASLKAYAETCRTKCNYLRGKPSEDKPSQSSCFYKCQSTHPANTRFKTCEGLAWLPY